MSINISKIQNMSEIYPTAADCRMKANSPFDVLPCYE